MEAVNRKIHALAEASVEPRIDRDIFMEAVRKDADALMGASGELQSQKKTLRRLLSKKIEPR